MECWVPKDYKLQNLYFTDSADAEFLAAILANIAVIAKKTPSGLLMSKVSRNQNKCQNSFPKKYVRALWAGPGLWEKTDIADSD